MEANALTPGEYIKAAEFGVLLDKMPTLTIDTATMEEMASLKPGAEKMVEKGVIHFREIKRGWVMNKTNVACLKALWGSRTEDWRGKRVVLKTEYQPGVKQDGIRVHGSPDIAQPVEVTIKLPRKKPFTMTMVPTGQRQGNGSTPAATQARTQPLADPLPGFLGACTEKLGLKAADVQAWADAERIPLATLDHAALIALFTDLKPGGAKRASLDAFVAGPPANPPAGDGYGDEPPPGEGRSYGDEGVV